MNETAVRPPQEHLKPQAEALLAAFMRAGRAGLTTGQLLNLSYEREGKDGQMHTQMIGDWRSRKSDLLKAGWKIVRYPVENSMGFRYVLEGYVERGQLDMPGVLGGGLQ